MISLVLLFIILCLGIGFTFKVLKPGIDVLYNDDVVLWYTSPNTNERKFKYLYKK